MISLYLLSRPAYGAGYMYNLDGLFEQDWRRSKIAIGGYHTGKFSIQNRGISELTDYYNTWIGLKIIERCYGVITYEGLIWQLDLVKNGQIYRRTLNPRYWHNRVYVHYTNTDGVASITSAADDTDSQGIYGIMVMRYTLGTASSAGAQAERDRKLNEFAYPRSRIIGDFIAGAGGSNRRDGLYITTVGFNSHLNWTYITNSGTDTPNNILSTFVDASAYVTLGRNETNSLSISYDLTIPSRRGDFINSIVAQGDSSGNPWKGGVYAKQTYIYEPAPTTVDYVIQNGELHYHSGGAVQPAPFFDPGFFILDLNAPTGYPPYGASNQWSDPRVAYCDEVEYTHPNLLTLSFADKRELTFAFPMAGDIRPPYIPAATQPLPEPWWAPRKEFKPPGSRHRWHGPGSPGHFLPRIGEGIIKGG